MGMVLVGGMAEGRSAHGNAGLTVATTRARSGWKHAACVGRGEADGGGPRGSGGRNESLRLGMGGGGESLMGTAPLPRRVVTFFYPGFLRVPGQHSSLPLFDWSCSKLRRITACHLC
jgi:hypothetical protein